jgi:hypothetical protein
MKSAFKNFLVDNEIKLKTEELQPIDCLALPQNYLLEMLRLLGSKCICTEEHTILSQRQRMRKPVVPLNITLIAMYWQKCCT